MSESAQKKPWRVRVPGVKFKPWRARARRVQSTRWRGWRARALGTAASTVALLVLPTAATATASQPELHLGSRGAAVRTLERDLTKVAIKTTVNGRFTNTTRQHVIRFQRRAKIAADGIVGPQTWRQLNAAVKTRATKASAASASDPSSGGSGLGGLDTSTDAETLTLNSKGLVNIPADAPTEVKAMLTAANRIAKLPYLWGGGHSSWNYSSAGYDCSGSVSFILHAAGLMNAANGDAADEPFASMAFANYGRSGASTTGWMTLWVKASSHVYMKISNLWFDTGGLDTSARDRWTTFRASPASGFVQRHPVGW